MRKLAWIIGIVVIVAAAGTLITDTSDEPANAEPDQPDSEQQYLDQIRDETPALTGLRDATLIDLGHAICADIDNGMTPTDVTRSIQDQGGPYEDAASSIVGEAQIHLCI